MSDDYGSLGDYLDGVNGYVSESDGYSSAPVAPTPQKPFRGNALVSTLRLDGIRLGALAPEQLCSVQALSRLAWAYLALMADGRTSDALGVLSVFRAIFNDQRSVFVSGFSDAGQRNLPTSLPDTAWTSDMRLAMQIILLAILTESRASTLSQAPDSAASLGTWYAALRAVVSDAEETALNLRAYLNIPQSGTETLASVVAQSVVDDIRACRSGSASTGTSPNRLSIDPRVARYIPTTGATAAVRAAVAASRSPQGSSGGSGQNSGGSTTTSGGGGMSIFLVLAGLAAVGYWFYTQDSKRD